MYKRQLLITFPAIAHEVETTYDRVMKSGKIRCAYALRPPMLTKNLTDGKFSGIGYDITEEVAKRLSLDVEWVEEVGFGTIIESIKTGRVDMGCGVYWQNAARARFIQFSKPFYYEIASVYKRADDPRAFSSYEELNRPEHAFSSIDGGTLTLITQRHFPKAKEKTLPELSPLSETIEDMLAKKADFVVQPTLTAKDFLEKRPGTIVQVIENQPIAYYPVVLFLPAEDIQFKTMIDAALTEIEYDGTLSKIIEKHGLENDVLKLQKPQKTGVKI